MSSSTSTVRRSSLPSSAASPASRLSSILFAFICILFLILPGTQSTAAPTARRLKQSHNDITDKPPSKCTSEFVATNEFRTIQPWECVPKGLHIRINFETGLKEAKLVSPEDSNEDTAVLVLPTAESIDNSETMDEEELVVDDTTEPAEPQFSYLHQVLASLGHVPPLPAPRVNGDAETILEGLSELEDVVGDMADGVDFLKLREADARRILEVLLLHEDERVRVHSARVLSACFSNNPPARKIAHTRNYLPTLLHHLHAEKSTQVQSSLIFTLGTLLRGDLPLLRQFHSTSPQILPQVFQASPVSAHTLRTRILRLVNDLLETQNFPDGDETREMWKVTVRNVSQGFCGWLNGIRVEIGEARRALEREEDVDSEMEAAVKLWKVIRGEC
ncbi:hypothetical protein BC829DRAFT_390842 [Chytridium lagenaria]|nr:hypothetical protein BC829DRAFT_390842 [Chytridium lagenaria]